MRKIIHIDMDAFYASVEQRDRPELRGKPVVVGGSPQSRSVVCAASYEARRFGVRSAMPCAEAARRCPTLTFLPPDFPRYKSVSCQLHGIFRRFTDIIEPLALDEAFLDVTSNKSDIESATHIAEDIRRQVRKKLDLTCSAGVGPNKFIAKVASDQNKPDGICVVPPLRVLDFLAPLPVRRIPGIGPVTESRLSAAKIETITDLRTLGEDGCMKLFGSHGDYFWNIAHGIDKRPVQAERKRKSIGIEDTFQRDITSRQAAEAKLNELAKGLEKRIHKHGNGGLTLTLKVKYHDFRSISRSSSRSQPFTQASDIFTEACRLMDKTKVGSEAVRLLGLSVSKLDSPDQPRQLELFQESST